MTFSLDDIPDEFLAYVREEMGSLQIEEQSTPDVDTLQRDAAGRVPFYICVQFGDEEQAGARSFIGPWGDDYVMPVYAQVVGPQARNTRLLANKLKRVMLGWTSEYSSEVRKRVTGHIFPLTNSDGATEAYVYPVSFGVPLQLHYTS